MNIALIEPYFTGSHKNWALNLKKYSQHFIELFTLPGRYWKWRMHGGAISLADKFNQSKIQFDLILSTDMLNLPLFLSLTKIKSYNIPSIMYFHENQLSYPWSKTDRDVLQKRDKHYGFINYSSALVADLNLFNSSYHMNSFFSEVKNLLKHFPDYNELETLEIIKKKSQVLPLGIDLQVFDKKNQSFKKNKQSNIILWNHRWEYDKNPKDFLWLLNELSKRNISFQLILLGETFRKNPTEFNELVSVYKNNIIHVGYTKHFQDYVELLQKSSLLPVTSIQDFFGISIVEASYCGCIPLLPNRLTYPELFSEKFIYNDLNELLEKTIEGIIHPPTEEEKTKLKNSLFQYDWSNMIQKYDEIFSSMKR